MKKIKVFYHLVDLPGYEDITNEQLTKMESSGLLFKADIYMLVNYSIESSFDRFKEKYCRNNIHWICNPDVKENFAHPSFIFMQQMAINSTDDFYALFLEQKGITYQDHSWKKIPTMHWRWCSDYFCIEKWRDCISKLDEGYDNVGCLTINRPMPVFAGYTSWATSDILKRSKELKLPGDVNFQRQSEPYLDDPYRCDVEVWYGNNNAKRFSFFDHTHNLYGDEFPPDRYVK
jgi:hypothetical protein